MTKLLLLIPLIFLLAEGCDNVYTNSIPEFTVYPIECDDWVRDGSPLLQGKEANLANCMEQVPLSRIAVTVNVSKNEVLQQVMDGNSPISKGEDCIIINASNWSCKKGNILSELYGDESFGVNNGKYFSHPYYHTLFVSENEWRTAINPPPICQEDQGLVYDNSGPSSCSPTR